MPRKVKESSSHQATKPIEPYDHKDKKRANNPPVGLVKPETDPDMPAKKYAYDPHPDPQLVWAGKAERTSFEVPTVSLHVHERIDPRTIIEAVRKRNCNVLGVRHGVPVQASLFETVAENLPLREAIDFYKHPHGWAKLAKNLKAEIDPELMKAYRGTISLPFESGKYRRVAVKIVDDRGIESLRVVEVA